MPWQPSQQVLHCSAQIQTAMQAVLGKWLAPSCAQQHEPESAATPSAAASAQHQMVLL